MSVQTITDAILQEFMKTGIKERTIGQHYNCFYHALCKEAGTQELDEALISSFLLKKYGRDILHLFYHQLNRYEQICKHAFQILIEYKESGQLRIRDNRTKNLKLKEENALDEYLSSCAEAGNVVRTIKRKQETIKRFLSTCSFQEITSSGILAYIQSFFGKSPYYQKREVDEIRKFLAFCWKNRYIHQNFDAALPCTRAVKDSRLPSVFTDTEIRKLLQYLSSADSLNQLRNYAMVLMMAVYGFRSIDISNFACSGMDLKNGTILISQSKTGASICHSILPHIGNALTDYILEERPESSSPLLFLKTDGTGLSSKTVSGVVRNAFLSYSIDIGARRYGSHSLRYSLATSLINDGQSIFTVANVLGQTSAETARLYAKVDISRLSRCALEVPSNE